MAMALIGTTSAASATTEEIEVETDRIADVSFSKQVEGVMGLTQDGGESKQEETVGKASETKGNDKPATTRTESEDSSSSEFKSKGKPGSFPRPESGSPGSRDYSSNEVFVEGLCDPDTTAEQDLDLCEDIWETICNPDDEVPVADDLCDWLGLTADVDWYDGEDFDYDLEYAKIVPKEESKNKYSSMKNSKNGRFAEGMCDPDKSKNNDEKICNEVWDSLCNPDDEMEVDDDFCDWIGFTADVDWDYSDYDYFEDEDDAYDSYDSEDRARKNLRG
eukprot:270227_1